MFRRIWNSLWHGDSRTKAYLWAMVLLSIAVLSLTTVTIVLHSFPAAVLAAGCLIIDAAVFQSISFRHLGEKPQGLRWQGYKQPPKFKEMNTTKKKGEPLRANRQAFLSYQRRYKKRMKKEKKALEKQVKEKQVNEKQVKERRVKEKRIKEKQVKERRVKEKRIKEKQVEEKQTKEKQGKEVQVKDKQPKEKSRMPKSVKEKAALQEEQAASDPAEEKSENNSYLDQYSEKAVEKLLFKYKIKTGHFPVVIDMCPSRKIYQAAAYFWIDKTHANILALEETPRLEVFELGKLKQITYKKGVSANPTRDYEEIKKSPVTNLVFHSLLPACYREGINGRMSFRKNLFILGDDLAMSAASMKGVYERLPLPLKVQDDFTESKSFSDFFKEAYKLKILWKEGILDANGYKRKIREILNELACAELTVTAFQTELDRMVFKHLITEEYSEYYKLHRQDIRAKK